ncbi:MAG: MerR family transcriptional regulator [Negativicutes bacterium]|nr:MerR family transcriptional regulator [Negativicutes bacterium]
MIDKFSIGEMAKLHDIPVKTLRFYDEIGLFKPMTVNRDSGYRYYSTEQFEQLNTIQYLKYLGVPLKEIKLHLESRDIDHFLQLLKKQQEATVNKIIDLQIISNRVAKRIDELEKALKIEDIDLVTINHLPERPVLCIKEKITSRPELELSLRKLEQATRHHSSIFIGKVGLIVSQAALEKGIFDEYSSIFILPEEKIADRQAMQTLPSGDFACLYYRDTFCNSGRHYQTLLDYIASHGYVVAGDAVERVIIDQFIVRDSQKHLSEIQIPVKATLDSPVAG